MTSVGFAYGFTKIDLKCKFCYIVKRKSFRAAIAYEIRDSNLIVLGHDEVRVFFCGF